MVLFSLFRKGRDGEDEEREMTLEVRGTVSYRVSSRFFLAGEVRTSQHQDS